MLQRNAGLFSGFLTPIFGIYGKKCYRNSSPRFSTLALVAQAVVEKMAAQRKFFSKKEKDQALARFYDNLSGDESEESEGYQDDSSDGKMLLCISLAF